MSTWTYRSSDGRPPERLFRLVLETHDGRAPGADSEEKHEPVSDIDTVVMDSLKALDPEWPIREADIARAFMSTRPSTTLADSVYAAIPPGPIVGSSGSAEAVA